jgi:hypothetical protein
MPLTTIRLENPPACPIANTNGAALTGRRGNSIC